MFCLGAPPRLSLKDIPPYLNQEEMPLHLFKNTQETRLPQADAKHRVRRRRAIQKDRLNRNI